MNVKTNARCLGALLTAVGIGGLTAGSLGLAHAEATTASRTPSPVARPKSGAEAFARLPMSFEENQGQAAAPVRFLSRGMGYHLQLTPTEVVLGLSKQDPARAIARKPGGKQVRSTLRMRLAGANPSARVSGGGLLPGKTNYLIGSDRSQWHTGIPNYSQVRYDSVYPGVDLLFYGRQHQLEYDFEVAPGADPSKIRFDVSGADAVRIDARGDLLLKTRAGEVRHHAPVAYQTVNGRRVAVAARFRVDQVFGSSGVQVLGNRARSKANLKTRTPEHLNTPRIGFEVASYDTTRPLTIDPVLNFSTYLGGAGADQGLGIAVDPLGAVYVTGTTNSGEFPTSPNAFQEAKGAAEDAFIVKLNASGTAIEYSTFLGGGGIDSAQAIAVDAGGNAYITGFTVSDDFPSSATNDGTTSLDPVYNGNQDAFVAKLSQTGAALIYSTYLGGSGQDLGTGIAVDVANNVYVSGYTASGDFPIAIADPARATFAGGVFDAFVTKINPPGTAIAYSLFLGGTGVDNANGIAVDETGAAYVVGTTGSPNFPTTAGGADLTFSGGSSDAFVTKLDPAGALGGVGSFSTFLGGNAIDTGLGIAIDAALNVYVTGSTTSRNFPVGGGAFNGGTDAYVTKLSADGTGALYSRYLGGSGTDVGNGIAVDSSGQAYVVGVSNSPNFPQVASVHSLRGSSDAFITKFSDDGSSRIFSTFVGGAGYDEATAVAVDAFGNAVATGFTASTNFFTSTPIQANSGGGLDAFVVSTPELVPAPRAPSGLTARATSSTTIDVSFNDNSNNETGFIVERRTADTEFEQIRTLAPGETFFTDTNLTPNTQFFFRVRAVGAGGESENSNVASTRTDAAEGLRITATPKTVNFPTQIIGRERNRGPQTVTIRNSGLIPVDVTISSPTGPFSISGGDTSFTLEPGEREEVEVSFDPDRAGSFTGKFTVTGTATDDSGTVKRTVKLRGSAKRPRQPRIEQ